MSATFIEDPRVVSGRPEVWWTLQEGVATVCMNRPASKNSLRVADMVAVGQAFVDACGVGARAVLIRGEAGAFCAGRDLKDTRPDSDDTLAILRDQINPALARVQDCEVPTIAEIAGPALGFGFGLALACDIAVVADDAVMGSPFRNIGAVLDSGAHFHLRERLGRHRAAELIFTGRLVSGREAAAVGLVNRSVGANDLPAFVQSLARAIATGPTGAFRASKRILRCEGNAAELADLEAQAQAQALAGPDAREGIQAFKDKRRPRFVGR